MTRVLVLLLCSLSTPCFSDMASGYQAGQMIASKGVTLQNPETLNFEGLKLGGDLSSLQSLNDTTLKGRGADFLRKERLQDSKSNEPMTYGAFLSESQVKVIDAKEAHQINQQNPFYEASMKIEENPHIVTKTETIETQEKLFHETEATCQEGVTFELDVVRQLIYKPPPRQVIDTALVLYYPEYLKNVGRQNDEMGPLSLSTKNYQVDIERFRRHACPHFKPSDAVSGKVYKIDCGRIQNFSLVGLVDGTRVQIVDKYGATCQPVKLIKISYKHDTYQSEEGALENWQILTPENEQLVESHQCHEMKRECLERGEKRFDELVVTRPCWQEKITYRCISEPQGACKYLEEKGCALLKSECVSSNQTPCLKWERRYKCTTTEEGMKRGVKGSEIYCLDGTCHVPEEKKNTGMNEAVTYLSLLNQMRRDMEGTKPPTVFKGEKNGCSKHLLNFTDCCSSLSGWGVQTSLSKCSVEEHALAKRRNAKLCHYVGTYCADHGPFGLCIRKKSNYCCFHSKIAKIFHEQGRPQIGRVWGSAENPDCGPLSVEELQKLDFNKMDLRELYSEFLGGAEKTAKVAMKQMGEGMPMMKEGLQSTSGKRKTNVL